MTLVTQNNVPIHEEGKTPWALGLAFWVLGMLNNTSYVIMIASAKSISEGGTGLVFLANVLPSMVVKLTAPYWFDHVRYETRMILAFGFMVCSFGLVATLTHSTPTAWTLTLELMGVALGSSQCGLGEASLLAAAGKCGYGDRKCISFFSSGTGLAGVFGFLWKFLFNEWFAFSMSTTLWCAQSLALLYIGIFWKFLHPHLDESDHEYSLAAEEEQPLPLELKTYVDQEENTSNMENVPTANSENAYEDPLSLPVAEEEITIPKLPEVHELSVTERTKFVLTLWPYIIPLFVVYATEYSLQAGTWTAIGFPVDNQHTRDQFYEYSNWMYQAGVFVSRSSGVLGIAPMSLLWLMPGFQALNVVFFAFVAAQHFWYSYTMLLPVCFYVGLLGGAVYVHGYMRICADFDQVDRREFALASTSVAESFGIVCADILGLFIQSCLYQINNIGGAVVSCPIRARRWR